MLRTTTQSSRHTIRGALPVLKDAITAAGHTYTVFTPGDLVGFDFSQYRVVILNWDDTFAGDFLCPYTTALPALEAYAAAEGVVLVQGAIQDWLLSAAVWRPVVSRLWSGGSHR